MIARTDIRRRRRRSAVAAVAKLLRRQVDVLGPADGHSDSVPPVALAAVDAKISIVDQRQLELVTAD